MSRIVINPDICNGQPTIEGTRITAQTVMEFLSAGDSVDDVLDEYPSLSREDVLACLAFSSSPIKHQAPGEYRLRFNAPGQTSPAEESPVALLRRCPVKGFFTPETAKETTDDLQILRFE